LDASHFFIEVTKPPTRATALFSNGQSNIAPHPRTGYDTAPVDRCINLPITVFRGFGSCLRPSTKLLPFPTASAAYRQADLSLGLGARREHFTSLLRAATTDQ